MTRKKELGAHYNERFFETIGADESTDVEDES